MRKIGIIGHGSFGQFIAGQLAPHFEIFIHDSQPPEHAAQGAIVALEQLSGMDAIILAVPLDSYTPVLRRLKALLDPKTLVIDICSVKVRSRGIIMAELASHPNILVCHPLFGPRSAALGTAGHQLIVTDTVGERAEQAIVFCQNILGLHISHMTAEEHDQTAAYVHVLPFFLARGLNNLNLSQLQFETPSFKFLKDLISLDTSHSDELFTTIQLGNPYGREARRAAVQALEELERSLGVREVPPHD